MPDVDHRQMCKYENKFVPGYSLVVERLEQIRKLLLKEDQASQSGTFEDVRANLL